MQPTWPHGHKQKTNRKTGCGNYGKISVFMANFDGETTKTSQPLDVEIETRATLVLCGTIGASANDGDVAIDAGH
jgi:hypothetical protein